MNDQPQALTPQKDKAPDFLTDKRFDTFGLDERLSAGLRDAGFELCTPIQAQVLPVSLEGKDVAGQAQTGTGKTAAFLVTVISRLLAADRHGKEPDAIILAPTRELAFQICDEAEQLCRHTDLRVGKAVGGVEYRKQMQALQDGLDILVGTPGRIIDYYKQGVLKTNRISIAVIDEADRLLDLGFAQDMRYILRKLPHFEKRQSMLFSATLSYRVMELTYDYMNLPEFIAVTPEEMTVEGVEQSLLHVGADSKLSLLLGLLEREDWTRAMIFVNTKAGVAWLAHKLKGNGLPAEGITGDLPQKKRLRLMEDFRENRIRILVATDVASRGIHVEDISHVFNYDLPQDSENYIHRIGRTARAGKKGRAISLACETYVFHLEPLEEMLGFKIPIVWHEEDWLIRDKSGPYIRPKRSPRFGKKQQTSKRRPRSGGKFRRHTAGKAGPKKKAGGGKPATGEQKRRRSRRSRKPPKRGPSPKTDA